MGAESNKSGFAQILEKNNLKPTINRMVDFRLTLGEIVKNK